MLWMIISLLTILGIGTPILMSIYDTLLNSTNGSWLNWTVSNATVGMTPGTYTVNQTAYTEVEYATFRFMPLLAVLFALAFILTLLGGAVQRKADEDRMRGIR